MKQGLPSVSERRLAVSTGVAACAQNIDHHHIQLVYQNEDFPSYGTNSSQTAEKSEQERIENCVRNGPEIQHRYSSEALLLGNPGYSHFEKYLAMEIAAKHAGNFGRYRRSGRLGRSDHQKLPSQPQAV